MTRPTRLAAALALALAACGGGKSGNNLPPGSDTGLPDAGEPSGPLPAPTSLAVSESGDWGLGLTWDVVPGANGYRVYASLAPATPTLAGDAGYNGFRYSPVELGATYDFRVAALDRDGVEGTAATLEFTLVPATPANLRVTGATASTLDLAWDAVPRATGYVLYHCQSNPCTREAETADTHATVSGLVAASFQNFEVKAKGAGGESASSMRLSVRMPPEAPAILGFGGQTSNSVQVAFEAKEGADDFVLEIAAAEAGPYFPVGMTVYPFNHLTATGLRSDGTYSLRVTARNSLGAVSGAPRSYTMTHMDFGTGAAPPTPIGLALAPSAERIDVSWTGTYDIYTNVDILAAASEAGPFVPVAAGSADGHAFTFKPLAAGMRYCVALESVSVQSGAPVFSGVSEPVCATTTAD